MKVRSFIHVLILAVAFSFGVLSPAVLAESAPVGASQTLGRIVSPGFEKYGETKSIILYINPTNSQLEVKDKRNGKVWRSNPIAPGTVGEIGELWQQNLSSVFSLTYTSEQRDTQQITNSATEQPKIRVKQIKNGAAITYDLQMLEMRFTIEFSIADDHLDVKVPEKLIREKMTAPLVALELLPFFGAAADTDKGYAFFPDGCGAVSYFKEIHPEFHQNYSESVYGADQFTFPAWDTQMGSVQMEKERVQLPVFGLVKNTNAFLGTITEGEADAKVTFSPSGFVVRYTRVSAEFLFRKPFQAAMRRNVYADRVEKERIKGDRAVRYTFLADKEASYVGMAKAYRRYLVQERGVNKLKATKSDMPFSLRLFNGVKTKGVLFENMLPMTTFDEGKRIIQELEKRGIKNIEVTLIGWNKGGFNGLAPKHFPADSKLGGDEGLKEFIKWLDKRNYNCFLQDDYLNAFGGNGGFIARLDTARSTNKMPYLERAKRNYLLNPVISLEKFAKKTIPQMKERYNSTGLELRYAGKLVITDRNLRYRMDRQDWVNNWVKIIEVAKKTFNSVAVQGGNAYVLGKADRIVDAPVESNEYLFSDERVPFWQIATHGLVMYTGYAGNLRSDYTREFLRDLEYGAIPMWELAYRLSLDIKDTAYNRLFSYLYTDWLADASREYAIVNKGLGHTYALYIEGHNKLAKDVFMTTYEDGTKVIVNYSEKPFKKGDLSIKSLSYKIISGGKG